MGLLVSELSLDRQRLEFADISAVSRSIQLHARASWVDVRGLVRDIDPQFAGNLAFCDGHSD